MQQSRKEEKIKMQDKKKEKDYNLNIFFRGKNKIDMACYDRIKDIREQYGFTTKQVIIALTIFYESFINPDKLNDFPLFNMGGFGAMHLNDNTINTHEENESMLNERGESAEQSVEQKQKVFHNNNFSGIKAINDVAQEPENIEAETRVDDAAIASYLIDNNMMFGED